MAKQFTYRDAGVDIEKAEKSLAQVKQAISGTHNSRVLKDIGAFGGFYEFPANEYRQPVLVSSTDGVGTKLKVAMMMNRHDTIGQDLVNHCINDIAVCGAAPLFFLDYYGCGKLDPPVYQQIVQGLTDACKTAELPLIGGETAEMPDLYQNGDYDLAGTIVGVVEKEQIIDGSRIEEGDVIIGAASSGLHTNGYSLARKVLFSRYQPDDFIREIGNVLGDELLKIHTNYFPVIREVTRKFDIKGMAHITGGGLLKNTRRVMPEGLQPDFEWNSWEIPAIFRLIEKTGSIPTDDMQQTFNLGIGLVFILPADQQAKFLSFCEEFNHFFYRIGKITGK
ncbi:MAG: phosphoribosylformylglycinamidine cyclo-ligase [Calditrichia bacterium]